ncbi:MAG TPA: TetR/AcrR family transcriptional regulator [Chthonomonadaceae bacterium]|nr:TetR/AcrR family transcriptional regulator [Chthonomonadaceae bacterium]
MTDLRRSKGEATRERILTEALTLFAEKGYAQTTMREIAAKAECSLGLAYRYFKSKDTMVLALYERMVTQFAEEASELPSGPLAQRWGRAIRNEFVRLEPNRGALLGLTSVGMTPGRITQVLGQEADPMRRRMLTIFHEIVAGSRDAPRPEVAEAFSTLFYALYLVLVLFWLQDASPGQRVTHQLIAFGEEMLGRLRLVLRLPWATEGLVKLGGLLGPVLKGERA